MLRRPNSKLLACLAALTLMLCALTRAEGPATKPAPMPAYYTRSTPTMDSIGKVYMGREIANVMGHQAADWLERPEREKEEAPDKAIRLLALKPTDVVADIGAGSGYFSFRIAAKVPKGKVIAEDIQQEMLDLVNTAAKKNAVTNVQTVLGDVTDVKIPANTVDLAIMVDAYHEFDHPREMMQSIVKALKPGGRVVLLEYRGEDRRLRILPHHKMTQVQAKKEMAAVGLKFVKTFENLPEQHLMIFEKPGGATQAATTRASSDTANGRQDSSK
jgi:ubiquinone/menaquinone biosynthesis C-methylase UbiE